MQDVKTNLAIQGQDKWMYRSTLWIRITAFFYFEYLLIGFSCFGYFGIRIESLPVRILNPESEKDSSRKAMNTTFHI